MTEERALAIAAYELQAQMDAMAQGEDWRGTTRDVLATYLDRATPNLTEEHRAATREYWQMPIDESLAAQGAPSASESANEASFREHLSSEMGALGGTTLAFDLAAPDQKSRKKQWGYGRLGDCDKEVEACRARCSGYCTSEASRKADNVEFMASFMCVSVTGLGLMVTANPTIIALLPGTCAVLSLRLLGYIKGEYEETCLSGCAASQIAIYS